MANYAASDAMDYATAFIKSMPIQGSSPDVNLKYKVADYASSLLWTAAPWSWTLGLLNSTSAITGTTSSVSVTFPADFLYINSAWFDEAGQKNYLKTVSHLEIDSNVLSVPSQIAADTTNNRVIVYPAFTAASASFFAVYKKTPPKITSSNFSTPGALVFPDAYFPVYQAGVLWLAYQYADDQRAGNCTVDQEGKLQWTQQAGVFQGLIAEMRKAEKLPELYDGERTQSKVRG